MPINPAAEWGQIEVPLSQIEGGDPRDENGNPLKAYPSPFIAWSANNGGHAAHQARGLTAVIRKRPPTERETPPGYSGSGNVSIQLKPHFKYFRLNAGTGSEETLTGTVSCNPDEAVQIVGLGSATYA
jgi:hypothetical protein